MFFIYSNLILKESYLYQLSLGQKARVQIIAALASETKLLVIDEITAVLDPMARAEFTSLLKKEAQTGRTIFMATNIPGDSEIEADRVLCIKNYQVKNYEAA